MKTIIKNTMLASVMVAALSFTSCKKSEETTESTNTEAVDSADGMSSAPIADTVVKKDGDTIIETGTENDSKQNTTGTQVP